MNTCNPELPRMLVLADWFFLIFHTVLVLFNITGWAWKRSRRWNLLTLSLTAVSWFVVGICYGGVGYCICTDWHWQVRHTLGYSTHGETYIQFLVEALTGFLPPLGPTKWVSGIVFGISVIASVMLNIRDSKEARASSLAS